MKLQYTKETNLFQNNQSLIDKVISLLKFIRPVQRGKWGGLAWKQGGTWEIGR